MAGACQDADRVPEGLAWIFHEGRASGCASHRHTVLLAALGPRRSSGYAFVPRLPDAWSAGGWLCRAEHEPYFHNAGVFNNSVVVTGSPFNATQPS